MSWKLHFAALIIAAFLVFAKATGPGVANSTIDQLSVVHILVECEDPNTGHVIDSKGSGVIITEDGIVLTAFHVVSCKMKDGKKWKRLSIKGKIGSTHAKSGKLYLRDSPRNSESVDIALLNFLGTPRKFKTSKICALRAVKPSTKFWTAGFPLGKEYQPLTGTIGEQAPNAQWAAGVPLDPGMSGGPVVVEGYVVALVRSGIPKHEAIKRLSPIYRAKTLIEDETGQDLYPCRQLNDGSVWVDPTPGPESPPPPSGFFARLEVTDVDYVPTLYSTTGGKKRHFC